MKTIIIQDKLVVFPEIVGSDTLILKDACIDTVLAHIGDLQYADRAVLLDCGGAFTLPPTKTRLNKLLIALDLTDKNKLDQAASRQDTDYDHWEEEKDAAEYIASVLSGLEASSGDDQKPPALIAYEAYQRFIDAATRRLSELFLCGNSTKQEFWFFISSCCDSYHGYRAKLFDAIFKFSKEYDRGPSKNIPTGKMGLLFKTLSLQRGGATIRSLPSPESLLAQALGRDAKWSLYKNNAGYPVGFSCTASNLTMTWVDLSASFESSMDKLKTCAEFLGIDCTTPSGKHNYERANYLTAKAAVEEVLKKRKVVNPLVGNATSLLRIYPLILAAVSDPNAHILVYGEPGSGKEALSDLLDKLQTTGPFIRKDVGSLTDPSTLKSEVFGHKKGAFTGALDNRDGAIKRAAGGTLVLDNLQNADRSFFALMLRVLEPAGEYSPLGADDTFKARCRVIAIFNELPEKLVQEKRLPPDWQRRFDIRIDLPPLNDRREDIPLLVDHFVEDYYESRSGQEKIALEEFRPSKDMLDAWCRMNWSGAAGNVGGLQKAVKAHCRTIAMHCFNNSKTSKSGRKPGSKAFSDEIFIETIIGVVPNKERWAWSNFTKHLENQHQEKSGRPIRIKTTLDALIKRFDRIPANIIFQFAPDVSIKQFRKEVRAALRSISIRQGRS